jgi:ubiquinone/menaquinone biosynthesis C-methylase UbiE
MADQPDDTYTHGHADSVLRSHRWRTVDNSAAYLLPHLHPGTAVLDVGCGPGTISIDLAGRVAPAEVVALDAAADVVAAAQAAAADAGATNLTVEVGDVYALRFADHSFDVVHAHQVLQHVGEPVAALREMRRVCRPDGVVAARDSVYRAMHWYPRDPGLDRWLEVYCAVAEANRGEPDAGTHLLAWAHEAGFRDVRCSSTAWCYATPAERAWWSDLWAERTTAPALAERAVELGVSTADELAELGAAWRRWGNHPDAWFAVPSGEILATP